MKNNSEQYQAQFRTDQNEAWQDTGLPSQHQEEAEEACREQAQAVWEDFGEGFRPHANVALRVLDELGEVVWEEQQ